MTVEHACVICGDVLEAAGVGLTLVTGGGSAEPVFATDDRSRELEDLQFTLGEGPALDVTHDGVLVVITDVTGAEAARRWPIFTPEAIDRGVKSIIAVPIQTGAIKIGVVDCYRELAGLPSMEGQAEALVCAEAAIGLAVADVDVGRPGLAELIDLEFTEHRAQVHQATGMVSVQLDIGLADALVRLRAHAYAYGRKLGEVADDVVRRRVTFRPEP
ncbi:ANTAR domain-containing protein [Amycolatopsis thailandensis]|uniref:ANTAR domain-containing protein n=1 Tax=Amycolatopsis thailandensis TaxID=589330 RepID=UPI001FC9EFD8|nr:ANTAR domain-containing protein [Amycolatopsis thailandensis]